jgi:hypothetical protein
MRLDIPMANAPRMNIKQSSKYLIRDDFDIEVGHRFFAFLLDVIV